MEAKEIKSRGMEQFYILWFGQFVSIFATRMTRFAITLWAWELTGTTTALVLVGVASSIPSIIFSPIAGTLVDRWNRKFVMMLSDFGSAFTTLILLLLFLTENIEMWHLYAAGAIAGVFGSFQYPAYSSVVSSMVSKEQLSRANSMRTVISSASGIGAPLLAGVLIVTIKINGIMLIDLATFLLAFGTLVMLKIPQPKESEAGKEGKGSIWEETIYGLKYIIERKSLAAIFIFFAVSNIAAAFGYPIMSPMILSKTGDNATILGTIQSVGSAGFLIGGLITSFWSGPKKRIHGINFSFILWGLMGAFVFGTGWGMTAWVVGAFFMNIFNPMLNSLYIAILQSKIEPDLQGRIFGLEYTISIVTWPLGQVAAGLLVDNFLEPGLMPGGSLSVAFSSLVGTGPGAGMGLIIVISGFLSILVGIAGYAIKSIRDIETLLPDHDAVELTI
ncbi:MAG: MFS transporter [Chloroflexota bacterium]